MRFQAGRTAGDYLEELRQRAEQAWGAERRAALDATLEASAAAMARLSEAGLAFLDDEPDYIRGGARGDE
jgi:hypothetical protein